MVNKEYPLNDYGMAMYVTEQERKEAKERKDNVMKIIKQYPWYEYDENYDFDWIKTWARDYVFDYKLKLNEFDTLYKEYEYKLDELRLDDLETYLSFIELEKSGEIFYLYEGVLFDPLMRRWQMAGLNNGFISAETKIKLFFINKYIENDRENIIDLILRNELSDRFDKDDIAQRDRNLFSLQYYKFKMKDIKRLMPMNNNNFSEVDLERICKYNLDRLELGMKLIQTQYEVKNGYIDILAEDCKGKKCIIELKVVDDCKDLIFQSAYYPTQFDEDVRMIAIYPDYKPKILAALKNMGNVEIKRYYFQGINDDIHFEDVK